MLKRREVKLKETEKVSLELKDTSSEVGYTEESEIMNRIVQEHVADDSGMIHIINHVALILDSRFVCFQHILNAKWTRNN